MRSAGFILLIISAIVLTAAVAFAVSEGRTLEFKTPMGKVVFDGTVHAKQFASCNDCHRKGLFEKMKRGEAVFKMAEMYEGKFCGSCHNGDVAFNAMDNCKKCHKEI